MTTATPAPSPRPACCSLAPRRMGRRAPSARAHARIPRADRRGTRRQIAARHAREFGAVTYRRAH